MVIRIITLSTTSSLLLSLVHYWVQYVRSSLPLPQNCHSHLGAMRSPPPTMHLPLERKTGAFLLPLPFILFNFIFFPLTLFAIYYTVVDI